MFVKPKSMELNVVLERDAIADVWIAEVPGILGCSSEGKTREGALENLREAFRRTVEANGWPSQPAVEFARIRVDESTRNA